jgi:histone acetyltransferase (RNA polymerase elongator complex component)
LVVFAKRISKQWIRFNRIQRDFPPETSTRLGYASETIRPNLRQFVKAEAEKRGIVCQCIRCREVKKLQLQEAVYTTQYYRASDGDEYFIAANNSNDKTLYGFIRLRLEKVAFIRELHVYGFVTITGKKSNKVQHKGIGKELLRRAELLARIKGYKVVKIISGVGVREYYRNRLYKFIDDDGQYMVKELNLNVILRDYIKWLFNRMLKVIMQHWISLKV